MAVAETIKQTIQNNSAPIIAATKDYIVIGGIVNNLLSTNAYLTLEPFLINAKIEQGIPFQLQTKLLIASGETLSAIASDSPINLAWNSDTATDWNSDTPTNWNSPQAGAASVLLNLVIAEI